MKRNTRIVLALLLSVIVVFAFAGCGGNKGNISQPVETTHPAAEDTGSESNNNYSGSQFEWPDAELPIEFIKYPNGTVEEVILNDDGFLDAKEVSIGVSNTDENTFDSYVKSLVDAG